ncbi:MAG: hypothetical protein JSS02_09880 [Planctomycetes bacterium]|nr:hypothetical protein [Planctomycetota bacterium]
MQLLDWTGRQLAQGKKGRIPDTVGPILERLQLDRKGWCDLVAHFGRRFFVVAGAPTTIDGTTSRVNQHRDNVPAATRQFYREVESRKASTAQRSTPVLRFTSVAQPTVQPTLVNEASHNPIAPRSASRSWKPGEFC